MRAIPEGAPATLGEAFAHIGTVTSPTILDMKVMVLVEAAAERLYHATAETAPNAEVRQLLIENGHEEMKHAHRVAAAIKAMTGEDFPAPPAEENPYLTGHIPTTPMNAEAMRKQAEGEFGGDAMYAMWADAVGHAEAAALFRANGAEETDHGNRLMKAAAILEAA